jgi:very-short-patch-repair endonuclease
MSSEEGKHRQPPRATVRARKLRRESTIPERILWGLLRDRRLAGLKFRRQVPVGAFVVVFACQETKVVVELDGLSHVGRGEQDDARQRFIESQGWRVVRVTNDELLHSDEAVAHAIVRAAGMD